MIVEGCNFGPPGAANSLQSLRQVLPPETPSDYFEFLLRSDGAQVWFEEDGEDDFDCLRIYSISRMLQLRKSLQELFPSLVVIGGDQGSGNLGFDRTGDAPWHLVFLVPGCEAIKIADSFAELEKRYFLPPGETVTLL